MTPSVCKSKLLGCATVLLASAGSLVSGTAAEAPAERCTPPLPVWVVESSLSVRECYDSNVFGTETERAGFPIANRSAWVTTVTGRFLCSPAALDGVARERLVLGYAPTSATYSGISSENNLQHRFLLQSTGKSDAFSWSLDSAATYFAGSRELPRYSTYNVFGIALPRERRRQWQDSAKLVLRQEMGDWFGRICGSLLSYDLLTEHHNPAEPAYVGYVNFVDRYDINGGVDLGWKATKDLALFAGWRHGAQFQQAYPWSPATAYSSSNRYDRILAGVEGKFTPWLTWNLSIGPDFRHYTAPDSLCGIINRDPTCLFVDTTATITLSKADSLLLSTKQWRWVASTGRVTYDDRTWSATWKHTVTPHLSVQLVGQFLEAKYATYPAAISATARDDVFYTSTVQVLWMPTKQVTVTFDYTPQSGGSDITLATASGRGFNREFYGATAKFAF